jgi:hypothetical protein
MHHPHDSISERKLSPTGIGKDLGSPKSSLIDTCVQKLNGADSALSGSIRFFGKPCFDRKMDSRRHCTETTFVIQKIPRAEFESSALLQTDR